jgi:lambda repressor-like predicted transcriptional regulator
MSSTQDLVRVLKAELRRAGITYAQLAVELGLAESSIKRIFAKGDMPLSRIDEVLAVLKLDFAELARQVAAASPQRQELTLAQERAVVADPKLLLAAICVLSHWTLEQIVQTYTLSKPQAVGCLLALDKLGFIELRANNRYRLKIDKTFRWRPDGPVMQYFRDHAVRDYFERRLWRRRRNADAGARPDQPGPRRAVQRKAAAAGARLRAAAPGRPAVAGRRTHGLHDGGGHALVAVRRLSRAAARSPTGRSR